VQEREIGYTGKKECNRKCTGYRGRGGVGDIEQQKKKMPVMNPITKNKVAKKGNSNDRKNEITNADVGKNEEVGYGGAFKYFSVISNSLP
jgi:hypothetical protein